MKNFTILGVHGKIRVLEGAFIKNQDIEGGFPNNGGGGGQFVD